MAPTDELCCPRCAGQDLDGRPPTPLGAIPVHCETCDHWWLRWPKQPCRYCRRSRVLVSDGEWLYGGSADDGEVEDDPLRVLERTWRCQDCNKTWTDQIHIRNDDEHGLGWSPERLWLLPEEELVEKAGYWGLVPSRTSKARDQLIDEMLTFQHTEWNSESLERAALDAVVNVAIDYGVREATSKSRRQLIDAILRAQD